MYQFLTSLNHFTKGDSLQDVFFHCYANFVGLMLLTSTL